MKQTICALLAVKNEEINIVNCLKSVKWVDEIIIVDNYSHDKTVELARNFTNKIVKYKGDNLGEQRELGLKYSKSDWILIMDADERISEDLREEICKLLICRKSIDAYFVPYENYFYNKILNYGNQKYKQLRLIKRSKLRIIKYKVHPTIKVPPNTSYLKGKMIHYSFRSIKQVITKFNYYARNDVYKLKEQKEVFRLSKLITYPLHMVYTLLVKEKGYKDGYFGIIIALLFGYYELVRMYYLGSYESKK